MQDRNVRQKIIDLCLDMNRSGLNQGTSGNISARHEGRMLITPSGTAYEQMKPEDLASMSLDDIEDEAGNDEACEWVGPLKPSSEWHFHRSILRANPSFGAVIHTHSTYATVLSIARRNIPACHYMIAAFGGNDVRCAEYATFGTPELSANIAIAMEERSACLLANHGMIAAGSTLDRAMWAAVELETLCKQYHLACLLGDVTILPDTEMQRVARKFRSYGPTSEPTEDKVSDSQTAEAEILGETSHEYSRSATSKGDTRRG